MSNLGTLTLDLVARIGGFTGPLDKAERASKKNAAAISKHQREVTATIGSSIKSLAGWAAGFVAFGAIKSFVTNSYAAADAIGKVAATAGITTDTLQEMRHAASLNGISFDQLDQGMQKFNKNIGELRAGTGTLYTYLQKTDRALLSQVQSARSTDDALDLVFKSMKNVADSSERSALAVATFGRSGQRLAIMTDAYEELRNEARELGLVIDSDLIKGAEIANDKMDTMARIIKTQLISAVIEVAPIILNAAQGITELTRAVTKFFGAADKKPPSSTRIADLTAELEELEAQIDAATKGSWDKVTTMKGPLPLTRSLGAAMSEAKNIREELGKLGAGASGGGVDVGLSQQQTVEIYKKAFSELETITPKIYDVMKGEYQKDRDEFIELTGDKLTAQKLYNKNMEALNKKLKGEGDDNSWSDFGKALGATPEEQYNQRLELIKKSNAAIAAENDRQLKDDIARDVELRKLTEQADLAELNNKYNGVELEIELHKYKFEKLKELYEEGSEELAEIERTQAAEHAAILKENDYWGNYLSSMEENMSSMDSIVGDSLNNFSSQFGNFFASAITDSETLGDAFKSMVSGMATSALAAIGKMIAQWLVYKAVKIATDKATQAAAIPAYTANAQASALLAGINAYASAAAIPFTGWAMAPGAMASALAVTEPMAAAVAGLALAGMAHDGINKIPEDGTWLLKKGERVISSDTSKRLDNTLVGLQNTYSNSSVNNYEGQKEAHYHYHSHGPVFLNRSQMRDAAKMLMKEIDKEKTRLGAVI